MGKRILVYTGGLIALYLVVKNYGGTSNVLSTGSSAVSKLVTTLQGR